MGRFCFLWRFRGQTQMTRGYFGSEGVYGPEEFEELKRRIERGDPVAVYEAVLACSGTKVQMPEWLAGEILKLIIDYHLGKKPSWKGKGNRPIIIIRRRIEKDIKRRAVVAVRAWRDDPSTYNDMPSRTIESWFDGKIMHSGCKNLDDVFEYAEIGLQGLRVQRGGPTLKCSPRTLKRVLYDKNHARMRPLPLEITSIFGLKNPDDFFGTSVPVPPQLK